MDAPERIYLPIDDSLETYARKDSDEEIEYTRTDAIIEKAWDWFEDNILSSNQQDKSSLYYEQFRKYMKGE